MELQYEEVEQVSAWKPQTVEPDSIIFLSRILQRFQR